MPLFALPTWNALTVIAVKSSKYKICVLLIRRRHISILDRRVSTISGQPIFRIDKYWRGFRGPEGHRPDCWGGTSWLSSTSIEFSQQGARGIHQEAPCRLFWLLDAGGQLQQIPSIALIVRSRVTCTRKDLICSNCSCENLWSMLREDHQVCRVCKSCVGAYQSLSGFCNRWGIYR